MRNVCPDCMRNVGTCDRCDGAIVTTKWASVRTPHTCEHYHLRCLTTDEREAYEDAAHEDRA